MTENTVQLQRCTLTYTNVSPFRLQRVAQAERARYIREELDGIEPEPPEYIIHCGGGTLPNGKELAQWDESHPYTSEYIDQLQAELDTLDRQPATSSGQVRALELRAILAQWDDYRDKIEGLARAIRKRRYEVGLWHTFKANMPKNDDWVKEQIEDGLDAADIPTDKRERLLYWLETEAVATQDEFQELLYIAEQDTRAIEIIQEARRVTREMFQRPLGDAGRAED